MCTTAALSRPLRLRFPTPHDLASQLFLPPTTHAYIIESDRSLQPAHATPVCHSTWTLTCSAGHEARAYPTAAEEGW